MRYLSSLFTLAKGSGGNAHRFRDSFAVELLPAGVPLERVSVLLGHSSVKITQKDYTRGCWCARSNWRRMSCGPGAKTNGFSLR
jgi:integrase